MVARQANPAERALYVSGIPVAAGFTTWSGGGVSITVSVPGAVTTDKVFATINIPPTQAAYLARAGITGADTMTLTLSAANTGNDAKIAWEVRRP